MRRKILLIFLSVVTAVCLCLGITACGSGGTDEKSTTNGSEQTDGSLADNTSNNADTSDKENNDDNSSAIIITVYIGGEAAYTVITDKSADYKIKLETPEDITTDTFSEVYFVGWYLDSKYTTTYNEDTRFTEDSAVYAKMLTVYVNDFTYTVNNAEATITGFTNTTATEVVIPANLNTFPVTAIGDGAFTDMTMIRTLYLPDGIETIDDNAFYNCNSMSKIIMPDSVTSIGSKAFYNCALLESITIPEKVTSIGDSAFYNCELLKSITIPENVTSIGNYAFSNCTLLTEINYNACSISNLSTENQIFYNAGQNGDGITVNIGANVTKIPTCLFYQAANVSNVVFEDDSLCTEIGDYAFYGCTSLESVYYGGTASQWANISFGNNSANPLCYAGTLYLNGTLATDIMIEGITDVNAYAFYNCSSLESVAIDDSITYIGSYAFYNCASLANIEKSNNVIEIGTSAFSGCTSLTNINLSTKLMIIGYSAFYECTSLTSIELPDSVTEIGSYAFYKCTALTSITIPEAITCIEDYVFYGCEALQTISIPNSVNKICAYAFAFCSELKSVTTYNTSKTETKSLRIVMTYNSAFYMCTALESVVLPDSLTTISSRDFMGCTSLKSIVIGSNVTSLGESAFSECSSLTNVYYCGTADEWNAIAAIAIYNGNTYLTEATIYYYSETEPTDSGNYWHYVNGEIVVWVQ